MRYLLLFICLTLLAPTTYGQWHNRMYDLIEGYQVSGAKSQIARESYLGEFRVQLTKSQIRIIITGDTTTYSILERGDFGQINHWGIYVTENGKTARFFMRGDTFIMEGEDWHGWTVYADQPDYIILNKDWYDSIRNF